MSRKERPGGGQAVRSVAIVGASLAGGACVARLRAEGFDGQITVIDADPSAPYDRPPLSKGVLTGAATIELPRWWCADCTLLRGRADALDARALSLNIRLDEGGVQQVQADAVVIATGAVPRLLPNAPPGVCVLRSAADVQALRAALDRGARSVTIIGAGVLGCEIAATLRGMGIAVALVDIAPLPLLRLLGHELGAMAEGWMAESGVGLHLGLGVNTIRATAEGFEVTLSDGSSLNSDLVIATLGARPETGWLDNSGPGIGNGVLCDAAGAVLDTTGAVIANLYAAGDVAALRQPDGTFRRHESWTAAKDLGTAVADQILGRVPLDWHDRTEYFWTDLFGRRVRIAGRLPEEGTLSLVKAVPGRNGALYEMRTADGGHAAWIAVNCPDLLAQAQAGLLQ